MRLAEFVRTNQERILERWEAFARSTSRAASSMDTLVLRNEIPQILAEVADDMDTPQSTNQQDAKGKGHAPEGTLDRIARDHGVQRLDVGFRIDQAAAEFRALRASVLRLWEEGHPELTMENRQDLIRFNEAIDQIMLASMGSFAVRLDRYRDEFLAILGHDLRNPLGAIMMAARLLVDAEGLDAHQEKAAQQALRSAERMRGLLDDLLVLTRTRFDLALPLTLGRVDLAVVGKEVVDELRASHPDRRVRLTTSGDLQGEWDRARIAQVVSNLLSNALQHGDPAAPIEVSARPEEEHVVLAVHNEGPEILPSQADLIFEPFFRMHGDPAKTRTEGLGLGLYITRSIVVAHRGQIRVDSSREQGTTFVVSLPRRA